MTTREKTADHAELAACPFCGGEARAETLGHGKSARTGVKCADVDCPGSMRLVGPDEDGVSFWNRRPREAALLSEIAALRGELSQANKNADGYKLAAEIHLESCTQAERQRDESLKALERIAKADTEVFDEDLQCNVEVSCDADELSEIARQALANQGADQ